MKKVIIYLSVHVSPLKNAVISSVLLLTISSDLSAQQYGWSVVYEPPEGGVGLIETVDSLFIWAETIIGIRRSTDGGNTWSEPIINLATKSLDFLDRKDGWSIGNDPVDGFIHKSTDGGKTWRMLFKKYGQNLFGKALTKNKLVAVGYQTYPLPEVSLIIKTTDGGKNFTSEAVRDSPFVKYLKVDFTDSLNGWIYGEVPFESVVLLKTTNGGESWSRIDVQKDIPKFDAVHFLNSRIGWCWYYSQMFKTTDGGYNWEKIWEPIPHSRDPHFYDIHFIDSLKGWAFGICFYEGAIKEIIYRTNNGGSEWIEESVALSRAVYMGSMLNATSGFAAADEAVLKYGPITPVENPEKIPKEFHLKNNYPNPFNSSTLIEYDIPERTRVELKVYDILGRELETLVNEEQTVGIYKVRFDSKEYPTGIYFYKIKTQLTEESKGMIILK